MNPVNSIEKTEFSPRFPLGQIVSTPGALQRLAQEQIPAVALLRRHVSGDWGECSEEDTQTNNAALRCGARLFSVYFLDGSHQPDKRIWVITEADRSTTTLLLPEEY